MRLPLLSALQRKRRLMHLIDVLACQEADLRDTAAQIVELTAPGDELHVEIRELIEYLDR